MKLLKYIFIGLLMGGLPYGLFYLYTVYYDHCVSSGFIITMGLFYAPGIPTGLITMFLSAKYGFNVFQSTLLAVLGIYVLYAVFLYTPSGDKMTRRFKIACIVIYHYFWVIGALIFYSRNNPSGIMKEFCEEYRWAPWTITILLLLFLVYHYIAYMLYRKKPEHEALASDTTKTLSIF